MAENQKFDVTVSLTFTLPGDTKPHVTSQTYPDKDLAFVAETQRRLVKGLQTPSGD